MIEIRQKNLKVIIKFYNDFKMQRNICNIRKRKKKRKKFKAQMEDHRWIEKK